jgi:hypothetical protein
MGFARPAYLSNNRAGPSLSAEAHTLDWGRRLGCRAAPRDAGRDARALAGGNCEGGTAHPRTRAVIRRGVAL